MDAPSPTLARTLAVDYWHLVAHRSELAAAGDYLRLDWPLGELVLFNDEGEITAFDNLCPHRGTRLFTEDAGCGRAVCPYHGWSYRGGRVRVARPELFKACDLARAALNAYRTAWCGDFLFVGVTPRQGLEDQLAGLADEVAAISRGIAGRCDLNAIAAQASWRVLVENALESYHVPAVHADTLAPLALTEEVERFAGPNCEYRARIGAGRTAKGLAAMSRFFEVGEAFAGYRSLYLFPFAMLSSSFGVSWALQTYMPDPAAPGRTRFVSRLLSAPVAPGCEGPAETFLASTAQMNRRIFAQDLAICARVSPAFDLDAPHRLLGRAEARVRHFLTMLDEGRRPSALTPLRSARP